jgi:hypothetical protein
MKIRFLLYDGRLLESPYEISDDTRYYKTPLFRYFLRLKSLEYYKPFVRKVNEIRNKNDIPEQGLPLEYIRYFARYSGSALNYRNLPERNFDKKFDELYRNLMTKLPEELGTVNIFESSTGIGSTELADIVVFGVIQVQPVYKPIITYEMGRKKFSISIHANINKTELKDFIDENFDKDIKPQLEEFYEHDKFSLTPKALRVLDLRTHQKKKFKEIADILDKEFDETHFEDSVKKTCHNNMDRIKDLFSTYE